MPLAPRAPRSLALLLALALPACVVDEDGDGFNADEDCDDSNPAINPDAEDVPNGIDDNCDGATDETVGDDDDATGDDDDDDLDPGAFDVLDAVTGDWSCKGALGDVAAGEVGDFVGTVADFQEDELVVGAHVQLWLSNDPSEGAKGAVEEISDESGQVTFSGLVSACSFFAVRVWTEFEPQETYQTYQVNMSVAGTPPYAETLNSVAYSTYQLLPLTVGVEPEVGKGIAAGRMYDCAGDPIANAEASVGTLDLATGTVVAADSQMRYFLNEDPDGDQPWTSADGLFGGMNVSPGEELNLLAWGVPQDEAHCETATGDGSIIRPEGREDMCLLAYSAVYVVADSVNIANIDLKPYPDECYPADPEPVGR